MPSKNSLKTIKGLMLLFIISLNFNVLADGQKVGIKPGEWVEHFLEYEGYIPTAYIWLIDREVLEVNGTWIKLNYTAFWTNGTISSKIVEGNVSKGPELIFPAIVLADLEKGDQIYIEDIETTVLVDGEENREIPSLNITRTLIHSSASIGYPPFPTINFTAYWDKATGILVYMFSEHRDFNLTVTLYNTNAFAQYPTFTDPGFITVMGMTGFLVALIAYAVYKKYHVNKQKSK